ncbi:MAG: SDR family oxidoreductase [Burkholderiales bacterium]
MMLVTGATGTIGRELVPQLLAADEPVRVLTRDARKVAHLGDQVELAVGDLDRPETLVAAMQDVERLFLVTLGTAQQDANALAAAKQAGVQHVVKLSTLEAGNPALEEQGRAAH